MLPDLLSTKIVAKTILLVGEIRLKYSWDDLPVNFYGLLDQRSWGSEYHLIWISLESYQK